MDSCYDCWEHVATDRKRRRVKSFHMTTAELLKNCEEVCGASPILKGEWKRSGYAQYLSTPCRRRVKALKNIQQERAKLAAMLYENIHGLECNYAERYAEIYEKRKAIILGEVEPTDEDCKSLLDENTQDNNKISKNSEVKESENVETSRVIQKDCTDSDSKSSECSMDNIKGIPFFWLTVLMNSTELCEMVEELDEDVLHHLIDIKSEITVNPIGFTLFFYFSPNDYMQNSVLTKQYEMEFGPEKGYNCFEGPFISNCKGCEITWINEYEKKKSEYVGDYLYRRSFFDFFDPPVLPANADENKIKAYRLELTQDFATGTFFRQYLIPRAFIFFMGEPYIDFNSDLGVEEFFYNANMLDSICMAERACDRNYEKLSLIYKEDRESYSYSESREGEDSFEKKEGEEEAEVCVKVEGKNKAPSKVQTRSAIKKDDSSE